jgi:hypothetical protein
MRILVGSHRSANEPPVLSLLLRREFEQEIDDLAERSPGCDNKINRPASPDCSTIVNNERAPSACEDRVNLCDIPRLRRERHKSID